MEDRALEPIVLIDTGTKYMHYCNILRMGYRVIQVPWDTSFSKIYFIQAKGIIISNGPEIQKCAIAPLKLSLNCLNQHYQF